MSEEIIRIPLLHGESVTGVWTGRAVASQPWRFIYAPGAGADLRDRFGAFAAQALEERGIATLRFQFPYAEERRRIPDRTPVLEATWEAAIRATRAGRLARIARAARAARPVRTPPAPTSSSIPASSSGSIHGSRFLTAMGTRPPCRCRPRTTTRGRTAAGYPTAPRPFRVPCRT